LIITSCGEYRCNLSANACYTMCNSVQPEKCIDTAYCDTMQIPLECVAKKGTGEACGQPFECLSNSCASGVCDP